MGDPDTFIEVEVKKVSLSNMGFVVFLGASDADEAVPIFIGASEAHSISAMLHKQDVPRPLTHDLFKNVIDQLGVECLHVHVLSVEGGTFYASITFSMNDGQRILEMDSRPSDAIALALRYGCTIYLHRDVHAESKMPLSDLEKAESPEGKTQLEAYQEALEKAIESERFEDAAHLRDQIQKLMRSQGPPS